MSADYPEECIECGKRGDVNNCVACHDPLCNNHLAKHELLCDSQYDTDKLSVEEASRLYDALTDDNDYDETD